MKGLLPALVAVLILVGAAYFAAQYRSAHYPTEPVSTAEAPTAAAISTDNWKTYTNSIYGYTLKYPSDWTLMGATQSITLFSPEEMAARNSCEGSGEEVCGSTQVGSELFRLIILDDTSSVQQHIQALNLKPQTVTLNGQKASFYVDPAVTEHYVWDIYAHGAVYEILALTEAGATDGIPAGSRETVIKNQQIAVAIANTFKLTK